MDIVVEELSKRYGENQVLSGYSARFPAGGVSCIMGESGRGKTTLLRILMGLEKPDSGRITGLEGRRLGALFQEDRLCENISAASNLRLVCGKRDKIELAGALHAVGLSGCLDQPVREMSGGMKRRVAILRAVLFQPQVLFLDEPFQGLDETTYEMVADYVRDMTRDVTVLMVSHNPRDAERLGARIYQMD